MVMNAKKFCCLWHTVNETLLRGQTVSLHWFLEAGHRLWSAAEYVWLGCQLMTTHRQTAVPLLLASQCIGQKSNQRSAQVLQNPCCFFQDRIPQCSWQCKIETLQTKVVYLYTNLDSLHQERFYFLKQQVDFLYLFHSFTWIKKFPFWCFMALSSGCSPLGSFLIVFRVFSFWKVYVIHVKKKVSLCAWNQKERQCRTIFFCFLTQDPLRRNSLFNLPLIFLFYFIFLVSARVSWREDGDGGGREEGWTSLSGSDHYGHQGNNRDQRMWLQSRLSFTFCSLPPLLHGQSRK